ncbi:hypothetical protein MERGE_001098 [Pneumocystis wakefieldiae]|uniref:DNA damage-binding protein 1 n=1 Tax=Pneumocystis wakefieldiae TaxID=38082 RepID=A0A899G2C5_9ASCO|nr:hypothetical protein MERGE_001098 [Pneumocystis wakefieldiae]
MAYVVSAHKASSIKYAVKSYFLSPEKPSLVVAKSNRIEIYTLSSQGLKQAYEFTINGKISAILSYRPATGFDTDHLFIVTEECMYFTLSWDRVKHKLRNEILSRDIFDPSLKASGCGHLSIIDPDSRVIGLYLYQGLITIIGIKTGRHQKNDYITNNKSISETFNLRLMELNVITITFLFSCSRPTIAVLYQDSKYVKHLSSYEIIIQSREKHIKEGSLKGRNLDIGSSLLIPLLDSGIIVVGEQTLMYFHPNSGIKSKSILPIPTVFSSYTTVNNNKHLLADDYGRIFMLTLSNSPKNPDYMNISQIGITNIASVLVYLQNSYLFVGSHYGDSQLVNISDCSILQSFSNISPISDFCFLNKEGRNKSIVTCSGAYKDGSLRIIRYGIGMNKIAEISNINGVHGIWGLYLRDKFDYSILVISFVNETRILKVFENIINEPELEEWENFSSFDTSLPTLVAGNVNNYLFCFISNKSIRLIDWENDLILKEWIPETNDLITCACLDTDFASVSLTKGKVIVFSLKNMTIIQVGKYSFDHEVSCIDISNNELISVGLWTFPSIHILSIPTMELLLSHNLQESVVPRSICIISLTGINEPIVLIGMGDGTLLSYSLKDLNNGVLINQKSITIGTLPVNLSRFITPNNIDVFAISDEPTIIYGDNGKLSFSSVNLKETTCMSSFISTTFSSTIVVVSEDNIKIGSLDSFQQLQIQTIPLGELPRRVYYHDKQKIFGVLTIKLYLEDSSGNEIQSSYLKILDPTSFDVLDSFQLETNECVQCITTITINNEDMFVVGTGFLLPEENESPKGRIILFGITNNKKIWIFSEIQVNDAVYCIGVIDNKIIAGINATVCLYAYDDFSRNFNIITTYKSSVLCLSLAIYGIHIIIGDLMKSVSLLALVDMENRIKLKEIARDYNPLWMTCVAILDENLYIGAEAEGNLSLFLKDSNTSIEEKIDKLQVISEIKWGELINQIKPGTILSSENPIIIPKATFVTVDGSIAFLFTIKNEHLEFLINLQSNMGKVINGIGHLKHSSWRAFCNKRKKANEPKCFIDGDFIECFIGLNDDIKQKIVNGDNGGIPLSLTIKEVNKIIEDFIKLH